MVRHEDDVCGLAPTRSRVTPAYAEERRREADERRRLEECATEAIRTCGRIASHGVLFGIDAVGTVVVASANADQWLGQPSTAFTDDTLIQAIAHGSAIDPVRVEFDHAAYDAIVHRGTSPLLVELEPVETVMDYRRTGVVGALQRLASLTDPDELRLQAAREIKAITGFDRVMCYEFHDDGHGRIVADEREPEMEPYLGLHFPASDIPVQARALYLEKRSRAIVDTEDAGIEIRSILPPVEAIDLGPSELRSASPHHLDFMRNMGQAATVSLAIVSGDRLIGMFTCAHRSIRRIPVLLRRALEVLANQIAMQLDAAAEIQGLRRRLDARERRAALVAPLYGPGDVGDVLLGGGHTVRDIVPADGVLLRVGREIRTLGTVPDPALLAAVVDGLGASDFVSERLPRDHPDIAATLPEVAGMLSVSLGDDGDMLVFVRGEVAQEVQWLGDQTAANRDDTLSPRRSFSAWRESVTGQSAPWGFSAQDAADLGAEIRTAREGRAQAELAELAMRDALTGLHNRRYLHDRLGELLAESAGPIAVIFIDLDDFKGINDTHGHEAGDAVLAMVGKRLAAGARSSDTAIRLGGDEFVIVCVGADGPEATAIAERVVSTLADPIAIPHGVVSITASAGVLVASAETTGAEILTGADAAMYRAKRSGRGRVSA